MNLLLVAEYRDGKLLDSLKDLIAFAGSVSASYQIALCGPASAVSSLGGEWQIAEGLAEYDPAGHKGAIVAAAQAANADLIVFAHSSYGWDLAPRVALALDLPQASEVVAMQGGNPVVPSCNGKMRREISLGGAKGVLTIQAGAFGSAEIPAGSPTVHAVSASAGSGLSFTGYDAATTGGVDLTKAKVIVSAGRGIGKPENLPIIEGLAKALGGQLGASRPVVDSGWVAHERQVGTTGQTVAPKLYIACGISGAIQHLAGMKGSEYIIAINKDKDAPIGEVADILAVADLKELVPALTERLS